MNYKDYLVDKLKKYEKRDIILTNHQIIRLIQRNISEDEVVENIINPKRLKYVEKQDSEGPNEEKFNCYFEYSKTQCHRYVLVINGKIIVVTAIKIKRRWQKEAEKRVGK